MCHLAGVGLTAVPGSSLQTPLHGPARSALPRQNLDSDISGGFPGGSDGRESSCYAGDLGSIPALGRSLEKEMATHSSFLTWRIPWTEEPGGLQFMGSQELWGYHITNPAPDPRGFSPRRGCSLLMAESKAAYSGRH